MWGIATGIWHNPVSLLKHLPSTNALALTSWTQDWECWHDWGIYSAKCVHLKYTLQSCKRKPWNTRPLPSWVRHMKQPFGLTNQHHPCIYYYINYTWPSKVLFSQVPLTLTERWTTLWSVLLVGVVAKTLTGFRSRHVTHVTLPFCLNKLSPLLSCFTFLSFRPQVSIPANFFWDISVRFLSWQCREFWTRHDHFRRFPKKSEVFRRSPKTSEVSRSLSTRINAS